MSNLHGALGAGWREFGRHSSQFIEAIDYPDTTISLGRVFSKEEVTLRRRFSRMIRREPSTFTGASYRTSNGSYDSTSKVLYVKNPPGVTITPIEGGNDFHIDTPELSGKGYFDVRRPTVYDSEVSSQAYFRVERDRDSLTNKGGNLSPMLHWKSTAGKRTWLFDQPTGELASGIELGDPRHVNPDTFVGLLSVAYFSPDITGDRENWPMSMGLPGSDREPPMGAAQVPVLAYMNKRGLLESHFISRAEAVAKK
ncbi:MAG: hypothetical protein AAB553_04225 [Patescibacteria group bacterium]